jgi:Tol biopolymer transport system component
VVSLVALTMIAPSATPMIELASVDEAGINAGDGDSLTGQFAISRDGRFVWFVSTAANLTVNDTNGVQDLFVHDFVAGTTRLVSANVVGSSGNGESYGGDMTPDGRYVAFSSDASDLAPNDTNGSTDVFVRDMLNGTTTLVSMNMAGSGSANDFSENPMISADGRYVAFRSVASNLTPNDTNGVDDLFVWDSQTDTITLASVNAAGTVSADNGINRAHALTPDGRYVTFSSDATNLVTNDTNGPDTDAFVRDLLTGTTTLVSADTPGGANPTITPDGRYVLFGSAGNVYVRDMQVGTTELVNVDSAGTGSAGPAVVGSISADGRFIVFVSGSPNVVANDGNGVDDVFVRDRQTGTTILASVNPLGLSGSGASSLGGSFGTYVSDAGVVLFTSRASDLVGNDTNGSSRDVFVRDLVAGTTTLLSGNAAGTGSGNGESFSVAITADGRYAVLNSNASDLVSNVFFPGVDNVYRVTLQQESGSDDDGDGVEDDIDAGAGTFADSNQPPTSGQIVDNGGLAVSVTDAANPTEGVLITTGAGAGNAVFIVCGLTLQMPADSATIVTCGSASLRVVAGSARLVFHGGLAHVDLVAAAAATITENGDTSLVENTGASPITVTVRQQTRTAAAGETVVVDTRFQGYQQPIDEGTLNGMQAGRVVPVRWQLLHRDGTPITDLASASISVSDINCDATTSVDTIEELAATVTGLLNLGDGNYQINWKTSRQFAGSCKQLHLTLSGGIQAGPVSFSFRN